jgi:hypothetical protein
VTTNPWQSLDHERTSQYAETASEARIEHELVDGEYRGTEQYARPCTDGCGGTMQYRATVGALQCPDCRALAHANGTPIRGGRR